MKENSFFQNNAYVLFLKVKQLLMIRNIKDLKNGYFWLHMELFLAKLVWAVCILGSKSA